jgi:hypothetical protein
MPLGDAYSGQCAAGSANQSAPSGPFHVRDLCNYGYARGRCKNFPQDSLYDAVRFSFQSVEGSRLRLIYILEAALAPREHGSIEFDLVSERFLSAPKNAVLEQQALAFIGSYRRRRDRAEGASG